MPRALTDEDRAVIVDRWAEARRQGTSQAAFCLRQSPPISARTLRSWQRRFAPAPITGDDYIVNLAVQLIGRLDAFVQQLRLPPALPRPSDLMPPVTSTPIDPSRCPKPTPQSFWDQA